VIVAAGIPVNLDAMSKTLAPHHPVEPPPTPAAGSTLVQISNLSSTPSAVVSSRSVGGEAPDELPE
jgi:hypothetical protein